MTARPLADWLAWIERQHSKSIEMGLDRVRTVATRLGLERPARHVITVGGTNGKGSTVAFIEAIACAHGWRVGAYTSPHLQRYNERVRVDGRDVDDSALVEAFEAVESARVLLHGPDDKDVPLTYFEFGTLAALWRFERAGLDLAILEVGLGGRLDAVNIIDPDVAVITTVDLDHQDWLGNDREAIGFEKAGIARAWKPVVLGEDDPPASVLRHAYTIGASAVRAGCDYFFEPIDETRWRWREVGFDIELPVPQLSAPVQLRNAAAAIAALRALDAGIEPAAFAAGVAQARVDARLQRFERDGATIYVDVGHNPQAARALGAALRDAPARGQTFAIYAALADKDSAAVVQALAPQVDTWLLAGSLEAGARGQSADALAGRVVQTPAAQAERHLDVATALRAARVLMQPGDRTLVFGSFQAAADALAALNAT